MSIKDTMQSIAINQALKYIEGNPEENIPKLMELGDKLLPQGWYGAQRDAIRTASAAGIRCISLLHDFSKIPFLSAVQFHAVY